MDNGEEKNVQPEQPPKIIYLNETEISRGIAALLDASGFDIRPEIVQLIVGYHTNHLENIGLIKFITKKN